VLGGLAARSDERRRAAINRLQEVLVVEPVALNAVALERAIEGDAGLLVDETVSSVFERVRRLPPEVQRQLGDLGAFHGELLSLLAMEAPAFADEVDRRLTAHQALRSDVSIEVRADELAARPVQSIQELEATLTQADLEEFFDTQIGRS
jgi:hypothetical protein